MLVVASNAAEVIDRLGRFPSVVDVIGRGDTKDKKPAPEASGGKTWPAEACIIRGRCAGAAGILRLVRVAEMALARI